MISGLDVFGVYLEVPQDAYSRLETAVSTASGYVI